MIHTSGIPFFNPLLSMGGMPFPWTLPSQGSPPSSPPSSPVSNTSVWHRPQPARAASFTIDAILGRRQHEVDQQIGRPIVRAPRPTPYPTIGDHGGNSTNAPSSNSSLSPQQSSQGSSSSKAKVKRVRTIFTAEQLERLEGEFARQQYMVGPERLYLAAGLNLTEAQVKVWFQNRRIKWRKQYMEQQHAKLAAGSVHESLRSYEDGAEDHHHTEPGMSSMEELPASPLSPCSSSDVKLEDDNHDDTPQDIPQEYTQAQSLLPSRTSPFPSYVAAAAAAAAAAATLTQAYHHHDQQEQPADLSTSIREK